MNDTEDFEDGNGDDPFLNFLRFNEIITYEIEDLFTDAGRENGLNGSVIDFIQSDELLKDIVTNLNYKGSSVAEHISRFMLDVISTRKALAPHLDAHEAVQRYEEAVRQHGLEWPITDSKWADDKIDRILSDFNDGGHVETERMFRSILDVPGTRLLLAFELGLHHFNLNRTYTRPNRIISAADDLQKLHFEIRRIKKNMVPALFDHSAVFIGKGGKFAKRPKLEHMIFKDLHDAEHAIRAASDAVETYGNCLVDTLGKDIGSPMAPTQMSISNHRDSLNDLLANAWCDTGRGLTRKDDGEIYLQILGALLEAVASDKMRANGSQHLPKGGKLLLANARKLQLVQEPLDESDGPGTEES